jgi:hypothetical protein
MKAVLGLVMAAALISPTQASVTMVRQSPGVGNVILVEGGCGRDYHRNERGECRPNWREFQGRACPPGWHLGPDGRKCWPN